MNVSAARDCTWTVASEVAWITVNPASGQGNGTIAVKVGANDQGRARSSAVAVNDARVTVNQEAAPCRFELSEPVMHVTFEGGRAAVNLSTMDGCEWRSSGAEEWVRLLTPSGTGGGAVELDVSRNEGPERSTSFSIGGATLIVVQGGRSSGPGGGGSPSACSPSLDPDRATVRSTADHGSFRVVIGSGCSWTASADASWISLQRSDGSGPDTVTYQVSTNTSTANERTGSITVAGRSHRVTQQACSLSMEGGLPNLSYTSGSYDFRVNTDANCTWFANSDSDWLVLIRNGGTGSGLVTYRVTENVTNRGRVGTITIAGQRKVVTQQPYGQS